METNKADIILNKIAIIKNRVDIMRRNDDDNIRDEMEKAIYYREILNIHRPVEVVKPIKKPTLFQLIANTL